MSDGFDGCTFCRRQALHVEELNERIRQLEHRLYGREWEAPADLNLTAGQEAIVRALVTRDRICTIDFLIEVTRGLPNSHEDYPADECIRTQISNVRKKLTPFGLTILTVHSRGYRLEAESKARLLNWRTSHQHAA